MENLINIVSILFLVDGEFDEKERAFLNDLESDIEHPGFANQVVKKINELDNIGDDELNDLLYSSAQAIAEEEKIKAFELGITTVLCDGVITKSEVSNILTLAEALDIPMENAVMRLLFQVDEEEGELLIDMEEDLTDFYMEAGRVRYNDFTAFERNVLSKKNYSPEIIALLRDVEAWNRTFFGEKAITSFGPNFLTLQTTNPASRSKTFAFFHLKKDFVISDSNGRKYDLKKSEDFSDSIKSELTGYYNQISKEQV